jgi:hypothetical protein
VLHALKDAANVAGVAAVLMAVGGFACATGQAAPTMPTDRTVQQDCDAKKWSLPLPATVGRTLDVFF